MESNALICEERPTPYAILLSLGLCLKKGTLNPDRD